MKKLNLFFYAVVVVVLASTMYSCEISEMGNSQTIPIGERERDRTRIAVAQQSNTLSIHFQRTVGTVQVTIADEWGNSVFTETVDAAAQPSLTIPLMGLSSGSYVIAFSGNDVNLSGEFEI